LALSAVAKVLRVSQLRWSSDEPGTRWSQRRKVAKGFEVIRSEVIGTKVVEEWSARESCRPEVEP
jgi:hypothetical protein